MVRISRWTFVHLPKACVGHTYKVSAWNSHEKYDFCKNSEKISHETLVKQPPVISVEPWDITANVGDDIAINCTILETTRPIPALYIKKQSSSRILCNSHHLVAANTWQLRLSNVDTRDAGRYYCYSAPMGYTCEELNARNLTDLGRPSSLFTCLVKINGKKL